ncbi:uncharacterized protein [Triticum aestivum]|uniref:uncharacterized protein n=1 Tax=Triticum aestivum TaxID=4565 RepID=UPI001D015318|nr:uncharacterized protein LOC123119342 [Triticum aestivum]
MPSPAFGQSPASCFRGSANRPRCRPLLPSPIARLERRQLTAAAFRVCGSAIGYNPGPILILVPGPRISGDGLDTGSGAWAPRPLYWPLPFRGRAELVPEHGLWFGFSSHNNKLTSPPLPRRGRPC